MAGENRRWSIEASLVRREDRRKGKASHMDLLEEASEGGEGGGEGGVCGEKGNQVGAFRGEPRPRAALWEQASNMWGCGGRKVKFGRSVWERKLKASV